MRFICKDIDPQAKFTDLMLPSLEQSTTQTDNGNILSLSISTWSKTNGTQNYYAKNAIKNYYTKRIVDTTAKTIASFATWSGQTITTNMNSTLAANSYYFNAGNVLKLKTGMWFTIFTDSGIIFTAPQRTATSKLIQNITVVGTYKYANWKTGVLMDGETGGDYRIDIDPQDTIIPLVVDSNAKNQIVNVEQAKNNYIFFTAGNTSIQPLDYVIYNGTNYVILSMKQDKDQMLYIAVIEDTDTYTYNASNIVPTQYLMPQGKVVAWVMFDGTPASGSCSIKGSYNVSGVVANATGDFTVSFTNPIIDTNYCAQVTAMRTSNNTIIGMIKGDATYGNSVKTTALNIQTREDTNTLVAATCISVVILR